MPFQGARVQFLVSCRCRSPHPKRLFGAVGVVEGCSPCVLLAIEGRLTAALHAAFRVLRLVDSVQICAGVECNGGRNAGGYRLSGGTFVRSRRPATQKVWAMVLPAVVKFRNMERSAARIVPQRRCLYVWRFPMFFPLLVPTYARAAISAASCVVVSPDTRFLCTTIWLPASVGERPGCKDVSPVTVLTTIAGGHHDR
jgi:hypothetical protein